MSFRFVIWLFMLSRSYYSCLFFVWSSIVRVVWRELSALTTCSCFVSNSSSETYCCFACWSVCWYFFSWSTSYCSRDALTSSSWSILFWKFVIWSLKDFSTSSFFWIIVWNLWLTSLLAW